MSRISSWRRANSTEDAFSCTSSSFAEAVPPQMDAAKPLAPLGLVADGEEGPPHDPEALVQLCQPLLHGKYLLQEIVNCFRDRPEAAGQRRSILKMYTDQDYYGSSLPVFLSTTQHNSVSTVQKPECVSQLL